MPARSAVRDFDIQKGVENQRLTSLDGLRGVAALIVVCFHFACAFLPDLIPDQTGTLSWVIDTPIGILLNGPFAVSVFFVLSGFVVSNAAAKRRSPIYVNLPLRYIRLAVPVSASVIYAWALLKAAPTATTELNRILPHMWLKFTYQGSIPSLRRDFFTPGWWDANGG
jgi:peptidoglycan/LPS O-acetylase OafA/YrhL